MAESPECISPDYGETDNEQGTCECGIRTWTRWLPYIILLVAAGMFIKDMRTQRERAKIATTIKWQASQPIEHVLIHHQLEGRSVGIVRACPPNLVSNLIQALQQTVPSRPFSQNASLEGSECSILLIYTNGQKAAFRAVRLDNEPLTLYVGTILPEKIDDSVRARLSAPAKVENAGPVLGQILDEINAIGDRLPPDEELREKLQRTTMDAGATEVAPEE